MKEGASWRTAPSILTGEAVGPERGIGPESHLPEHPCTRCRISRGQTPAKVHTRQEGDRPVSRGTSNQ